MIIWVMSVFFSRETLLDQLGVIASHALPRETNFTEGARNFFMNRAKIFVGREKILGFISIVGFLWTSIALMSTVRKTVFNVIGIASNRSFLRQTIYDLRVLLIAGFFLTTSTVVTWIFAGLRTAAMQLPAGQMRFTLIGFLVPNFFALVLTFFLYFSIYRFLSYGKIRSRSAAFGAFWAALFYEIAKNLFAAYVTHMGNLVQTYGTLEAIFGSMLWIFYSTSVFIFGVELANINSLRRATA